jgi:hypothetical protein
MYKSLILCLFISGCTPAFRDSVVQAGVGCLRDTVQSLFASCAGDPSCEAKVREENPTQCEVAPEICAPPIVAGPEEK